VKALTLHQPWAQLVAIGAKRIETRSWSTRYRGPLAIHAGARKPAIEDGEDGPHGELGRWLGDDWQTLAQWAPPQDDAGWVLYTAPDFLGVDMPLGAVVATCRLVDVVRIVSWTGTCDDPTWAVLGHFIDEPDMILVREGQSAREVPLPPPGGDEHGEDITGQLPFGDYTPGRFAWLLADVEPLDPPVPARGRQGLWNFDGYAATGDAAWAEWGSP
jgi:hypothetical protein